MEPKKRGRPAKRRQGKKRTVLTWTLTNSITYLLSKPSTTHGLTLKPVCRSTWRILGRRL
ncbi:hypothetical protein JG687_00019661 [Phytophthora cactorum]|uniref:Uncharacterized protein n=1 Tax=Phytophthora cactorum TaxID=29920 RepID=A0A8T1TME6_9STRA|nr:hypothetical protein JG687_00019661 [Phytophthora cactorum]